jgi:putative transposase
MGTVSDDMDAVNQHMRDKSDEGRQLSPEQAAAAAMVAEARQRGLELTGPDGPLKLSTRKVLETALNEEISEQRAPAV